MSQGIRIMSHARGNPDTEVGRSLPDTHSACSRYATPSQKRGELKTRWESDHPIVLGGRESRSRGEGGDGGTEPSQATCAGHEGPEYTSQPP